jgi:hypothetical protein
VGGLEVKGFGASGQMLVEVIGATLGTSVEARIDCPEQPFILAGPLLVGTGSFDACEEEPCKTRRQNYVNAAIKAIDSERELKLRCALYKFFVRAFLVVFLFSVILLALSILCRLVFLFPTLCVAIDIILIAVIATMTGALARLLTLRFQLHGLQRLCGLDSASLRLSYMQMQLDCPRGCWIREVKVNCDC